MQNILVTVIMGLTLPAMDPVSLVNGRSHSLKHLHFQCRHEFQGQNVGTELATEEICRKLTGFKGPTVTDSVRIWCGTFGSQASYSKNGITITVPAYYYKILSYYDTNVGGEVRQCYWMPNDPKEKKARLAACLIGYDELVVKLGYDPVTTFYGG